jgi:hypothetical protein
MLLNGAAQIEETATHQFSEIAVALLLQVSLVCPRPNGHTVQSVQSGSKNSSDSSISVSFKSSDSSLRGSTINEMLSSHLLGFVENILSTY